MAGIDEFVINPKPPPAGEDALVRCMLTVDREPVDELSHLSPGPFLYLSTPPPHPRAPMAKPTVSLGAKFKMLTLCSYNVLLVCNLGNVKISTNTSDQKGKMDFGQLK